MRRQRLLQLLITLMIVAVFAAGCGMTVAGPTAEPSTPIPPSPIPPTAVPTRAPIKPAAGTFATDLKAAKESSGYGLILIVDESNSDQLAAYMVACGESGGLSLPMASGLMSTDVAIKDGKFTIDTADVLISGGITSAVMMEGTIEARSPQATKCGIPKGSRWKATCGEDTGIVSLVIGGKSISTKPGPCK